MIGVTPGQVNKAPDSLTAPPITARMPRLMSSDLPHIVAPERLARAGVRLQGQLQLRTMGRLAALLADDRGTVRLELAFSLAERGVVRISGDYATQLRLICQRCLEPVTVSLVDTINVGIVFTATARQLPGPVETLALTQDTMVLTDFIEDEILLGMPIAPKHEHHTAPESCRADEQIAEPEQAEPNPFHVLKTLQLGNS